MQGLRKHRDACAPTEGQTQPSTTRGDPDRQTQQKEDRAPMRVGRFEIRVPGWGPAHLEPSTAPTIRSWGATQR